MASYTAGVQHDVDVAEDRRREFPACPIEASVAGTFLEPWESCRPPRSPGRGALELEALSVVPARSMVLVDQTLMQLLVELEVQWSLGGGRKDGVPDGSGASEGVYSSMSSSSGIGASRRLWAS